MLSKQTTSRRSLETLLSITWCTPNVAWWIHGFITTSMFRLPITELEKLYMYKKCTDRPMKIKMKKYILQWLHLDIININMELHKKDNL